MRYRAVEVSIISRSTAAKVAKKRQKRDPMLRRESLDQLLWLLSKFRKGLKSWKIRVKTRIAPNLSPVKWISQLSWDFIWTWRFASPTTTSASTANAENPPTSFSGSGLSYASTVPVLFSKIAAAPWTAMLRMSSVSSGTTTSWGRWRTAAMRICLRY